jgi:hypothetical protein
MRILDEQSTDKVLDLVAVQGSEAEKGKPAKIFVVVRGVSPEICGFVSRLREVAESVDWREVIWVQDSRKLTKKAAELWFRHAGDACAVILGAGLEPISLLSYDCSRYEINLALLEATRSKAARESRETPGSHAVGFELDRRLVGAASGLRLASR